ncbi:MAG: DUF2064 domain-containing protein, partial [Alphaproteobacteria bacterium]|nr:DUF2064 domain-containing protein [Alphaproteobacteria bacterium]
RLGRDRRWRTVLAITPDGAAVRLGRAPRKIGQGRGNLGQRMARAFARAFTARPGPMVLIGTDIPGVRPGHIADAFRRLEAFDAVFGPAADGGYWLVGFRQPPDARVFARVRWSGPFALSDTLANLKGWTIAPHLETLADVDDGLSWGRAWRALTSGVP